MCQGDSRFENAIKLKTSKDYLVVLSPKEPWKQNYIVLDAPSASAAKDAVWEYRGYNSGEPASVSAAPDLSVARFERIVITYDAAKVESAKQFTRYTD